VNTSEVTAAFIRTMPSVRRMESSSKEATTKFSILDVWGPRTTGSAGALLSPLVCVSGTTVGYCAVEMSGYTELRTDVTDGVFVF